MSLVTSLVAYWAMSEASTGVAQVDRADSQGANTLVDPAHVSAGTGLVYSNALAPVEADGDFLYVNDNAALSMGNIDFTVAAWVKLSSKPANSLMTIYAKGNSGDESYLLEYDLGADFFQFRIFGGSSQANGATAGDSTFGSASTGTWYFVVGWYDATANLAKICVNDGFVEPSGSQSLGAYDDANEAEVARTSGDANSCWDGLIGPVMIWKRILTAPEITSLYNAGAGLTYAAMAGTGPQTLTPAAVTSAWVVPSVALAGLTNVVSPFVEITDLSGSDTKVGIHTAYHAAAPGSEAGGFSWAGAQDYTALTVAYKGTPATTQTLTLPFVP